jgi:uroporphyrin-III C-methyltransferase / precorrin-2 dehydrogenase / sirohydrochlorin ferrochelatase
MSADHVKPGAVTLVGAGPGDPGLLTLNALRALQDADVILFDDLVSEGVLELARREARRMLVGKRGRQASCRQEDISALMIKLARAGKQVVRLKGGDPGIFGRAGEELAALRAAGIACRMVPGITAALAMAAAFGVSLTHRDHAQAVQFVTGHARDGRLPAHLNWRGLADPRTTTVFYMGAGTVQQIAANLRLHGLSADTPALWVANLSRPDERRWSGLLSALPGSIGDEELRCPLLIGIGRVFAEADCGAGTALCELQPPMPVAQALSA